MLVGVGACCSARPSEESSFSCLASTCTVRLWSLVHAHSQPLLLRSCGRCFSTEDMRPAFHRALAVMQCPYLALP